MSNNFGTTTFQMDSGEVYFIFIQNNELPSIHSNLFVIIDQRNTGVLKTH